VNLGAPELIVILALWIVPLVVVVWGIVDAVSTPEAAWQRAGQNRTLWIALQAVGLLFCAVGLILSIVYFATIRPQLRRATA